MGITKQAIGMAKRYEPILLFHPQESFFPIDPKFYLERCALWRSAPPSDKVQDWGEEPRTSFPRKPQIKKGAIAALAKERTSGKTWIGDGGGPSFLVVKQQELHEDERRDEDRFLQLAGWQPFVPPPTR